MQLGITKRGDAAHRPGWLGSAHGTDNAATVTIKAAALSAFAEAGYIPSGIPLAKDSDGTYKPVSAAGDTLAGFLLTEQAFNGTGDLAAPMLEHGKVRVDRLPEAAFDVSTLTTPNPLFIFEKEA